MMDYLTTDMGATDAEYGVVGRHVSTRAQTGHSRRNDRMIGDLHRVERDTGTDAKCIAHTARNPLLFRPTWRPTLRDTL